MKSKNIYCYDGIKLGVDARQMIVGNKGTLEDRIDQNPEHLCYKFAKKFSEVYNDVGNVYEIFNRLKEITYAIALGRWMFLNKFPIDFEKVKKIYENTLIPNYQIKVKAIDFKKEKITHNNVDIDFDDIFHVFPWHKGRLLQRHAERARPAAADHQFRKFLQFRCGNSLHANVTARKNIVQRHGSF
jgi:hypothetical protein